jgi:Domain of unknown function (DUF4276)
VVTELRIHFEGDQRLREGFRTFLKEVLESARSKRIKFELVATGGKPSQFLAKAFRAHPNACNILLLDSDGPVTPDLKVERGVDGFPVDQVFWMVQVMETWFLADRESVANYYGEAFNSRALPGHRDVEEVSKRDVISSLKRASRDSRKGQYHKTAHAPQLLAVINPAKVQAAAPNCERLFSELLKKLG